MHKSAWSCISQWFLRFDTKSTSNDNKKPDKLDFSKLETSVLQRTVSRTLRDNSPN